MALTPTQVISQQVQWKHRYFLIHHEAALSMFQSSRNTIVSHQILCQTFLRTSHLWLTQISTSASSLTPFSDSYLLIASPLLQYIIIPIYSPATLSQINPSLFCSYAGAQTEGEILRTNTLIRITSTAPLLMVSFLCSQKVCFLGTEHLGGDTYL